MKFPLSKSGRKLTAHTGTVKLMDDLGEAMSGTAGEIYMMGGGNPAEIPEIQEIWRSRLADIAADSGEGSRMLVNYDGPAGSPAFREAFAACLSRKFGWDVGPENVAITSGGQAAFFFLFNMLAGEFDDGSIRKIILPITPEYIGYDNQGMRDPIFRAFHPRIRHIDDHQFKYELDFDNLVIGDDAAAICVSRPTNPSGNVLGDKDLKRLAALAKDRGIPLIIDNAYGAPFPNVVFEDVELFWNEDIILTFSLSKLGLPGTRTGIVVAHESIVERISAMTSVVGLANNNVGQAIVRPFLENDELLRMSDEIIQPFYRSKAKQALEYLAECFGDDFPYSVHRTEGAFFLWIWFPELPITSTELYERLKKRRVLVIPGEHFFYALEEDWPHSKQCIRLTFSQPEETVRRGIEILADELKSIHVE